MMRGFVHGLMRRHERWLSAVPLGQLCGLLLLSLLVLLPMPMPAAAAPAPVQPASSVTATPAVADVTPTRAAAPASAASMPPLAPIPMAVAAPPAAPAAAAPLPEQIDHWLREGFERPQAARAELNRLLQRHLVDRVAMRQLLDALAQLDLQSGQPGRVEALAQRIDDETRRPDEAQPVALAQLLRAQAADAAGRPEVAAPLAQAALASLRAACRSPAPGPGCDHRPAWRALRLLQRRASLLRNEPLALVHERAGLALAVEAGDAHRQAQNHATLALLQQRAARPDEARHHQSEVQRLAGQIGDLRLTALLWGEEARLQDLRLDPAGALRAREESVAVAQRAGAPRLAARLSANLSDSLLRARRPADALQAAERALPVLREHGDRAHERVALNNAGIARIGLGRVAEGLADLDRVLALSSSEMGVSGAGRREAETLREFGEALASAGAAAAALKLYHRERELSARLLRNEAEAARHELRALHDAEAQQRHIERLAKDNALKAQQLANAELRSHFAGLAALIIGPAMLGAVLLYRRARRSHRALKASHAQLRERSERDPLTGLANRRHLHERMQALGADRRFEGTLLLVDIDHFKRINDSHGHAVGDRVLVEVARRLSEAVRGDDVVVRWGGEEFLIHAAAASAEQAAAMAARVLHALAREPVQLEGGQISVTASIGHGHFPLPPDALALPWEQALHLVDLALYLAKREGRHRAVGLTAVARADALALHGEREFEAALIAGRVRVQRCAPAAGVEASGERAGPAPASHLATEA